MYPMNLVVRPSRVVSNGAAVRVDNHNAVAAPPSSTVTAMDCVAVAPAGSRAVTVTVAVPADTGVSVTVLPDALALAMPVRLELAV